MLYQKGEAGKSKVKMSKFKYGDTVYFRNNDAIVSGTVVAAGKDKEEFRDKEGNLIDKVLINNFYFIKGFPGKKFYENMVSDSPEKFL
jgi:hypothetical protein